MKIMEVDKGMVYFKAYLLTSPEILTAHHQQH